MRPERKALPSVSFGYMTPTTLFVLTCGHKSSYASANCCVPKLKRYEKWNGCGPPGFAPRPKYHASHGSTVPTHGTPAASHASATGLTTSGVDVASMRSTLLLWISVFATCAAVAGLDWLSLLTMFTAYFLPPTVSPFAKPFFAREMMYGSPSPKPPAGPVSGLTNPIVIVFDASHVIGRAQIGSASAPEATRPPAPTAPRLSNSRREMPPPPVRASSVIRPPPPRDAGMAADATPVSVHLSRHRSIY